MPVDQPDSAASVIDLKVLDEIMAFGNNGAASVSRLITLYMQNTPENIRQLRAAVAAGDAKAVRFQAHTMKSSSAWVGALSLATLLEELETLGRSNVLDGAELLLHKIAAESRAAVIALKVEFQRRGLVTPPETVK
jgi:HPt (histidine-containing phosphotransfer) domain-containing protein